MVEVDFKESAAKATPWWWQTWCDRIGAREENLDATRTTLALQLQERLAAVVRQERSARGAIVTLRFYSYVVDLMQKAVNSYCSS